jgi:hypothetical protein
MKTFKIFTLTNVLVLVVLVGLTSCSTMNKKYATIDADGVRKSGFIMAKPQVADIAVEKRKIEGKAAIKNSMYMGGGGPIEAAKNLAVLDAVNKGGADLIVNPMFEVDNNGSTTTATVSGFAGKYKAFRDITPADTAAFSLRERLDATSMVRGDNSNSVVGAEQGNRAPGAANKKKGAAAGALLGLLLLLALIPLATSSAE